VGRGTDQKVRHPEQEQVGMQTQVPSPSENQNPAGSISRSLFPSVPAAEGTFVSVSIRRECLVAPAAFQRAGIIRVPSVPSAEGTFVSVLIRKERLVASAAFQRTGIVRIPTVPSAEGTFASVIIACEHLVASAAFQYLAHDHVFA